ncbi:CBS domain-containing protein [Luteolibacter pohnpeiensis]|uniref:CBS domain-containing protein n=1 Tax=Luteolibacter pohnpeiensis TaxID=454153 RepID=A0A934S884_9BACT|nr:DUF294 nucleotidyltransferase-like domain-containing protein [Luteolibacter pohnpeiensis]MBK1883618.1 CBS domain-containing protein [Luteolibacter pohnpeiensis]
MISANVIPDRIAETLRRFPPFSMLPAEQVVALASRAKVRMAAAGDCIWEQGESPGDEALFVVRGRVEYLWKVEDRSERVDVRDVGDVLGFTALMRSEPYRVTAKAVEDCLLYSLPWVELLERLNQNDEARDYVRRHLFWISRLGSPVTLEEPADSSVAGRTKNILQGHLAGAQIIRPRPIERLLTCSPGDSIFQAASLMSAKKVPSILVTDEQRHPVGIVTSTRLVRASIIDGLPVETPVSKVMASPVVTVSKNSSGIASLLLMLRRRIGQVCVTEDGTPNSPALDVCSHKDLLAQSGHHPTGLLRELQQARSPKRFRELCDDIQSIVQNYLEAGVSAIYVGHICAELYDELNQRLMVLVNEEMTAEGKPLPEIPWAWMSVGSDGRREQILRTDMDNALVFASTGSSASDKVARAQFLDFSTRVIDLMTEAGFARCQGGVMAMNPRWCRTSEEWLDELRSAESFRQKDGLLRATILYDLRHVAGDASLCDELRSAAFTTVSGNPFAQRRLAESIVNTAPPLNFIGRLVVEKFGGGRSEPFDLKNRGMAPLRDAARLLTLKNHMHRRYSTGGRWDELRRSVPKLSEIAGLARDAYDFLMKMRTLNGLRRGDSGRFIDPGELTKLERAQLANVFDVVRMVQTTIRNDFNLDQRL